MSDHPTPCVHEFSSTDIAYATSQCSDLIRHGDVLLVPSEGVVGIMFEAWRADLRDLFGEG